MHELAVQSAAVAASETDRLIEALEPILERFRDSRARREHLALIKAVRLAPDLETCEAILRSERIPRSRLGPEWTKAYGL